MTPDDFDNTVALASSTPHDATLHGEGDGSAPSVTRRHMLVFSGSQSWMYQLPEAGTVVIGRSETAELRIDDPSISRQHARLVIDSEGITIVDLGSQNGTQLNSQRIKGAHVLNPNDVITIHKTTLLLHAAAPALTTALVMDPTSFHDRLEAEIDRSARYERVFSVLCLLWKDPPRDARAIERQIADQLRRTDATTWTTRTRLDILLAEASTEEATAIGGRIQAKLGAGVKMGHAACPADAYDADALLAIAHAAANGADPGEIAATSREFQTLTVGKQRVIVADAAMVRLYALIERLAPVDLPMLVTGETGCGKELVANAVHALSRRRDHTMVSLNCAAIQETLVESELFGHEKGAFSGATATKIGLLETASKSTLFLDEVGELSLAVQAKLLRVLETQRVTRVGDVKEREVDVRIVAATNRDLEAFVANGRFRQDLFFRLSAAHLLLPPLRQRPRELPLLAAVFLEESCRKNNRGAMMLSQEATAALLAHQWPGNVRELKNMMMYIAAAHHEDVVTAEHVRERLTPQRTRAESPVQAEGPTTFRPLADELRELEIQRIKEALEAAGNNQTRAAALLSMPTRTFFEKAKTYGLTPKKKKD